MNHRYLLEALDRSLRDLTNNPDQPFGGKVIVLAGDFRQVLPIIKNGSRTQIVGASIKRSPLWQHFKTFSLTENMRVLNSRTQPRFREFDEWLVKLGNGTLPFVSPESDDVFLPKEKCIVIDDCLLSTLPNTLPCHLRTRRRSKIRSLT